MKCCLCGCCMRKTYRSNKAGVFRFIIPISKTQNWQANEFEQTCSLIKTPAVTTTGDS